MGKLTVSQNTIGRYKAQYVALEKALADEGLSEEQIKQRISQRVREDSRVLGFAKLQDYLTRLDKLNPKSTGKVSKSKEEFRTRFDNLTNNLLYAINNTTDNRVANALSMLLDYDTKFKQLTGINQRGRNDFRGLLLLSPHINDNTKLSIYRGGWGDGSNQDRNQYSNGRRVPVAKSTGYALEQSLPRWTEFGKPESNNPKAKAKK